ncbi:helix-turn-helix domain-containing protein [Lactiplantibacillus modestisalitolerans]|uniref:Helix-turn-helix domain-containing protein n=1 Tax=Lactiplantibacillus modestisalitolerans TaxID=1457219 RepID=A0ABV5WV00_9LACO|nr:helix-turn-helix transcriptional regulator [Lactiplantibacillus modestisalitolerans]
MATTVGEKLACRIRQLRLAQHLTQEQLAERAGLDASVLSRIERGHRTNIRLDTLDKLVHALGVDYATLFSFSTSNSKLHRIESKLAMLNNDEALTTIERLIDLLLQSND